MATKNTSLICNKFGGIRRINATFSSSLITASDIQNVELFNTGINSGVGIRTAKGNISICDLIPSNERIINIFESVQKNTTYFFIHAENSEVGKIYLYNSLLNEITTKVDNLTVTGSSCGLDIAQGWSDLFVFSNGEEILSLEIGAETELKMMELVDMDNRTVKGLGF